MSGFRVMDSDLNFAIDIAVQYKDDVNLDTLQHALTHAYARAFAELETRLEKENPSAP